jgi:hypothetical protein
VISSADAKLYLLEAALKLVDHIFKKD